MSSTIEIPTYNNVSIVSQFVHWTAKSFPVAALRFALLIALVFSGCASNRLINITLPTVLIGTISSSQFSGWGLNWCSKGEPVKNLYTSSELNCAIVGGEIHVVRIKNGMAISNNSAVPTFDILVPAAIDSTGKHGIVLVVEKAPVSIASDTGVDYWAKEFSFQYSVCPEDKNAFPSKICLDFLRKRYLQEH